MLAALVKALAVVGINTGDIFTELCNTCAICLPEWKMFQEIISLLAG
jgi:hypothetical protein